MVSQSRPQQAWSNLPSFVHNPQVALLCFALYNTELRQIFPGRKFVMRSLAGPPFECVHIFFSSPRNNANGDVYCLRARDRVASAALRSLTCFRIWARRSSQSCKQCLALRRTDSRSGPRLPIPGKSQDRIVPLLVLARNLSCRDSTTMSVLKAWICRRPRCSRAWTPQLIWAGLRIFLLSLVSLHSVRDGILLA